MILALSTRYQALQPSPLGHTKVPPSPNLYGKQQDCRFECPMGLPQQASTHQHKILCQGHTSKPKLAYAQEASTVTIHCNSNPIWPENPVYTRQSTSPPLLPKRLKCIQKIIRLLLYYARAIDNKLLVALNAIRA
jgi:hypothetical protein